MTETLILVLSFVGAVLAVFALNSVMRDLQDNDKRRARQRSQLRNNPQQQESRVSPLLKDFSQIAADALAESQTKRSLRERLECYVDQSGLNLSVSGWFSYFALAGLAFALTAWIIVAHPLVAIGAGLSGAAIPLAYVEWKRRQRLERFRSQLPDAFDLMGRVLRSGQTISQAMQAVAEEFDDPIAVEFRYCSEQMNLGLPPESALRDLSTRTGMIEIKIFVLAVVVHRQSGGNLAELLDKLAHVTRERFRIFGMIRSLTAQGRFQAGILLSLPPFMFLLLMVLHREYEMVLLQYPTMIMVALGMMMTGAIWIRRIVNFDF